MDLTFTLTPSEVAALQLRFPKHTLEAGFHALMDQYVRADGEARLQSASIRYRELDPRSAVGRDHSGIRLGGC